MERTYKTKLASQWKREGKHKKKSDQKCRDGWKIETVPIHYLIDSWLNTLRPRHNGRHFPDDIFKYIFLNENVHGTLILSFQLMIFHHWFRQWLGADLATSHYLNQWWLDYRRISASLGLSLHLTEDKFIETVQNFTHHKVFENYILRNAVTSSRSPKRYPNNYGFLWQYWWIYIL